MFQLGVFSRLNVVIYVLLSVTAVRRVKSSALTVTLQVKHFKVREPGFKAKLQNLDVRGVCVCVCALEGCVLALWKQKQQPAALELTHQVGGSSIFDVLSSSRSSPDQVSRPLSLGFTTIFYNDILHSTLTNNWLVVQTDHSI